MIRRCMMALAMLTLLALAPAARAQAVQEEVTARPERYRVFVFGDKMATGLLAGLWRVLKNNPKYIARGRMREGSGLARRRLYDWVRAIPKVLDSNPVDIGVVMLGANDARDMRVNGKTLLFGSPEWKAAYEQRVEAVISAFRTRDIPLYWVGLPPVADAGRNEALKYINAIMREKAAVPGVRFVDIYKAFASESGAYTDSGFAVDGRFTRLRSRNGVHFIKAGNTRLASLVVDALSRGIETPAAARSEEAQARAEPKADVDGPPLFGRMTPRGEAEIVAARDLPDRNQALPPGGAGENAGAAAPRLSARPGSAAAALFVDGRWPEARKGRVDDFSPPR